MSLRGQAGGSMALLGSRILAPDDPSNITLCTDNLPFTTSWEELDQLGEDFLSIRT